MCRRSRERISESRRWGRRSCKQLSDTVTERKNLLPNSDLRAERDRTPAYAHAESYGVGQSYTIWSMILRALFCKDSSFLDCETVKPWCQTTQPYSRTGLITSNKNTVSHQKVTRRVSTLIDSNFAQFKRNFQISKSFYLQQKQSCLCH